MAEETKDSNNPTASADTSEKTTSEAKPKPTEAEGAAAFPDMALRQSMHRAVVAVSKKLTNPPDEGSTKATIEELLTKIATDLKNASLYRSFQTTLLQESKAASSDSMTDESSTNPLGISFLTEEELKKMDQENVSKMEELEKAVVDAKESAGDMEVMEARLAVAIAAAQSLTKDEALEAYQKVIDLPKISSGKKMDAFMESARIASFYGANTKSASSSTAGTLGVTTSPAVGSSSAASTVDEYLDLAEKLAKESGGGDWDRRNRLKVYRAVQHLQHRSLDKAAPLLLEGIATFSCTEICSYAEFLQYAILANLLHLPRTKLHTDIIQGPEILALAHEIPTVLKLVRAYYDTDYRTYLQAMVELEDTLINDRYLERHVSYLMRELHILAYRQFLDAYQSVTLEAMSKAFGVSEAFLDKHCSAMIASGRLSAKIDKFGGVIVSSRPDWKNAQYRDFIQKGDQLLNRIQKLARVVDV